MKGSRRLVHMIIDGEELHWCLKCVLDDEGQNVGSIRSEGRFVW